MSTEPLEKTPVASTKKPKSWKRRLKIAFFTLLTCVFVLRIIVILALPAVLAKVASFYDLDLKYDRASLALIGGNAALTNVKVYARSGGEPIFTADYLHGEILPFELLTG